MKKTEYLCHWIITRQRNYHYFLWQKNAELGLSLSRYLEKKNYVGFINGEKCLYRYVHKEYDDRVQEMIGDSLGDIFVQFKEWESIPEECVIEIMGILTITEIERGGFDYWGEYNDPVIEFLFNEKEKKVYTGDEAEHIRCLFDEMTIEEKEVEVMSAML